MNIVVERQMKSLGYFVSFGIEAMLICLQSSHNKSNAFCALLVAFFVDSKSPSMEWTYQAFARKMDFTWMLHLWWSRLRERVAEEKKSSCATSFSIRNDRSTSISTTVSRKDKHIDNQKHFEAFNAAARVNDFDIWFGGEKRRWDDVLYVTFRKTMPKRFPAAIKSLKLSPCCCWGSNDLFGKENTLLFHEMSCAEALAVSILGESNRRWWSVIFHLCDVRLSYKILKKCY